MILLAPGSTGLRTITHCAGAGGKHQPAPTVQLQAHLPHARWQAPQAYEHNVKSNFVGLPAGFALQQAPKQAPVHPVSTVCERKPL